MLHPVLGVVREMAFFAQIQGRVPITDMHNEVHVTDMHNEVHVTDMHNEVHVTDMPVKQA